MPTELEGELQEITSHITNGESKLKQLRGALDIPLLQRWNLKSYHEIPQTSQGCSLFAWAIQNKNTTALDLLMKNLELKNLPDEAPVDSRLAEKSNLLHRAVEYYDKPTWAFVLQRINTNRVFEQLGKNKTTVLHAAASRNLADIFRTLHDKVGDGLGTRLLKTLDGENRTVLHMAASKNTFDEEARKKCYDTVVELLEIQPQLIKLQDQNGETVFHKAVMANQKEVLQHLLTVDPNVLSKCDRNKDSAYSFYWKRRGIHDHIQNESKKDKDSFRELSRTPSIDEEIGLILHKAILGLDKNISTMRQLLFKDGILPVFSFEATYPAD